MSGKIRECAGCGSPLPAQKRQGNPRKWCSGSCRQRYLRRNNPEYVARQAESSKRRHLEAAKLKPPLPRCKNCDSELRSRRSKQEYCGNPECRMAKIRASLEVADPCSVEGCDRPSIQLGLCSTHAAARWRKMNPSKHAAKNSRYRANKRGAFVEDVDRDEVLLRDGWMCGICGEAIPRDASYPDPLSPSIDHVVPLSRGGLHEMKNVQASHFICNSRKRDAVA